MSKNSFFYNTSFVNFIYYFFFIFYLNPQLNYATFSLMVLNARIIFIYNFLPWRNRQIKSTARCDYFFYNIFFSKFYRLHNSVIKLTVNLKSNKMSFIKNHELFFRLTCWINFSFKIYIFLLCHVKFVFIKNLFIYFNRLCFDNKSVSIVKIPNKNYLQTQHLFLLV